MYPNANMPNMATTSAYGQYPYNNNQYARLAQMEQQQFASQQQAYPNTYYGMNNMAVNNNNTTNYLKGRPVVSMEEARAAQIDLDGSMFIFTDIGNKKIYTKQINLDGTATLNTYSLVEDTSPSESYITRAELESAIAQIRKEMSERSEPYVSEQPKQQQQSTANVVKPIREQPAF
jgi:phage/plasmid primase-like uncharacterized protein